MFAHAVAAQIVSNEHPCFAINPNQQPEVSIAACTDLIISDEQDAIILGGAHTTRGVALRALGLYPESIEDLNKALEYVENDPSTLRMLAWTYREFDQPEKAEQIYTRVLAQDDHWQGWLSRCAVRTDMRHYEDALDDCNKALEIIPGEQKHLNSDMLYFKALSLNELGRPKEAYETASMGFSPDDLSGRLYFMALIALWNDGQKQEIRPVLNEGLKRYPDDPDILYFIEKSGFR